jgi:hypothetical protein
MVDLASLVVAFDRLCGQVAFALSHSELQIYATIAVAAVLSVLLFPPKDDPNQI